MRVKKVLANVLMMTAVLLFPLAVSAQWSSDPLQNLGVAVAANDQVTPKMAATSDSGCYISWFDSRSGSYCMYLQRLNSAGVAQWATNGLLISSHPQMTSLVDYDLAVDQEDNAVLVFSDIRNGASNNLDVFAYLISPAGAFQWGADGVGLSSAVNTDFEPAPKVTATNSGNYVFAWMKSGARDILCFQKLSSLGEKLWGENGITLAGAADHRLSAPDLAPAEGDDVIAIWKDSTGPVWSPTTWLYTQKFAANGGGLWNPSGVVIYNQGHISAWAYPEILADGGGGAFYAWYDSPSLSQFNVSVGHVETSGNLVFPLNGVLTSTNSSDRLHMNPDLAYYSAGDLLYVFWIEENFSQSQYGVYGQRFSPLGERLWTDSGREFVALGGNQISFVRGETADSSPYVGYFEASGVLNNAVKAFRCDADGNLLWAPSLLSSATLGSKDDLLLVVNGENRGFLTWGDGRSDFSDIYAQNVNPDGSLGNPTPTTVSITLNPVNPPIVIPAAGGNFDFEATLTNSGTSPQAFDAWIMVQLPNQSWYGPVLGPLELTLAPGSSLVRQRTQNVPGSAPAGEYWYEGRVGDYPSAIWDTSGFAFTKQGSGIWNSGFDDWMNTGEEFFERTRSGASTPSGSRATPTTVIFPNPFNPTTVINFELPEAGYVKLEVFDVSGRAVGGGSHLRVLADTPALHWYSAGSHEITFDGSGLPSGVYYYRLTAGTDVASGKMVLMK